MTTRDNRRKKHRKIALINKATKHFCVQFSDSLDAALETVKVFNNSIDEYLPKVFQSGSIYYECNYSLDFNRLIIMMHHSPEWKYNFYINHGEVTDYLNPTNSWKNEEALFKISGIPIHIIPDKLGGIELSGGKPFEFKGDKVDIQLTEIVISNIPIVNKKIIEFAIIKSLPLLNSLYKDVKNYAESCLKRHYLWKKDQALWKSKNDVNFKLSLLHEMRELFNNDVLEEKIDNFFENNPLVLEVTLGIINPVSKSLLKVNDNLSIKDLKPDLIGYDLSKKNWIILDYKRAKKTIIKNSNNVRSSFKAEVQDLVAQLRDYKEYFQENINRVYFQEKYNIEIKYPFCVGVIGKVEDYELEEFHRQIHDLPKWVEIVPYNFIYDRFKRYIESNP